MSPAATPSTDPLLDEQLAALKALVADGLAISAAIRAQAEGGPPIVGDVAIAHARVTRAVRQSLMLQSRLKAEAALKTEHRRIERKARVERIVSRIALDAEPDTDEACALMEHARELLDDEDIYGDVMTRPMGELVAAICNDLGIEVPWAFLKEEAWAKGEAESGNIPTRPPPPAGEVAQRAGGGAPSHCPTPPQSLRDSSPASGGARIDLKFPDP